MPKIVKPDEEPKGIVGTPSSSKSLYSGVRPDFTEKELNDPKVAKAIAKALLSDVKRCESEILDLKSYKDKFYGKSEEAAVLMERLSGLNESVSIRSLLFTIGGLLGGLLFSPGFANQRLGMAVGCIASLLLALVNPKFLRKLFRNDT